ncbi:polysaccharide deacetylase family protein [Streptacidiphilus sp. P02-A3a]|uniref:polysaccharide deacetylase family protein n=1 Tax=Streptacidiphilus sp. P02-A3a TaxID=2704468 RepID=UPI0015FC83B1|nr:polysaccharide deacetylase family protein [Streptacidiphilus sp. P02-A3a]QMU71214.1 polysaccharide deacetylase family protein [Streptacidiphilus sp. P02-A3a]
MAENSSRRRSRRMDELAQADRMYAEVLADPSPRSGYTGGQVSRRVMLAGAGITLLAGCGTASANGGSADGAASPVAGNSPSTTPISVATPKPPAPSPTSTTHPLPKVPTQPQYYVDAGHKVIALTLDDGPSEYTGEILEILRDHHITATFCMIGEQIKDCAGIVRDVAAAGHHITNHTWDHSDQSKLTLKAVTSQIDRTNQAMADVGITPTMYRAPFGSWSHTVFEAAAAAGLRPLDWSVDPADWSRPGVNKIVSTIMRTTMTGSIILDHDGGGDRSQTVAAMRIWLPRLLDEGYRFTTP